MVTGTAIAFVAAWAVAAALMLGLTPAAWRHGSAARGAVRAGWALGWALYLAHVAAAFHLVHGWSHAAAYRHTAAAGGVGEGVFVNYLFGLVWGADAAWLLGWPDGYARRPRWVAWAVHGFLAFVTFNAVVVFGSPPVRWAGAAGFAVLGVSVRRGAWSRVP